MANLFTSPCTSLTDFNQEGGPYAGGGDTVTIAANAGTAGTGDSALKVTVGTNGGVESGVRVGNVGGNGRSFSFDFKLGTFGNLSGSLNIAHIWTGDTGSYGPDLLQLGITRQSGRTNAGYYFYLQTPLDSFAGVYYSGKVITDGAYHRVELRLSDDSAVLYVDGNAQCYIRSAFLNVHMRAVSLGKYYSTGYSGDLFFDNVSFDTYATPTVAATYSARNAAAYAGFLQESMRSTDGAVIRHMGYPGADGNYGYSFPGSDIVSEGQAYGMIFAVQNNDETNFIKMANFAYTKLARRNTAEGATATNNATGSPSFPSLMGWKYNDDIGGFYDFMVACDADNDAMAAYFWAHGRWGSSSLTPGATGEPADPNYLQRALDIAHDLKQYTFYSQTVSGVTYQIQSADGISGLNELNVSYLNPVAFKLAKQYDTANATFWQQAVDGVYLVLTKNALNNSYGGPTEWCKWDTGSQTTVQDTNRGDWNEFGYNAFRAMYRVYLDYYFYNEAKALTYLTSSFRTFIANEWATASPQRLAMQMNGAGTRLYSGYEKTFGTYSKYVTQKVGTPTSAASAIFSAKLDPAVTFHAGGNGSFWGDNAGDLDASTTTYANGDTAAQSYYGSSWGIWTYLMESGLFTNYGVAGSTVTRTAPFSISSQINTITLATRSKTFTLASVIKKVVAKPFSISSVILTASPTRQKPFSISSSIAKTFATVFDISSYIIAAPVGTQVSPQRAVAADVTLRDLVSLMQELTGNQDSEAETSFRRYLNLAQKDLEQQYSDHPGLRASTQFQLVPQADLSYAMPADFKSERFLRTVSPVNLSRQLANVPYERFRATIWEGSLVNYAMPYAWYWAPEDDRQIHVYPVPDRAYTVQLDYVRYANDLIADTDVSFVGKEMQHMLAFRALWYYYASSSVAQVDVAMMWQQEFLKARKNLRRSYQMRAFEKAKAEYGSRNWYSWR